MYLNPDNYADPRSLRERLLARKASMWLERSTWDTRWRDVAEFQQPMLGMFDLSQTNQGTRKDFSIYDNTATKDGRVLASGLMSGMTSPARPWFKTGLPDKKLMEAPAVKAWLHQVDVLMRAVFAQSNTYNTLHSMYLELGAFGTAVSIVEDDFDNLIRHHPCTIGEYALGQDEHGRVDSLARPRRMTVAQVVRKFGLLKCSQQVQAAWHSRRFDQWVDVMHIVQPRGFAERAPGTKDAKSMAWGSYWFEQAHSGGDNGVDGLLLESGMPRFRVLAARWDVKPGSIYGHSPGMECQGDVRQLQFNQLRKAQAIDYKVNPPLQAPTAMKGSGANRLPGGLSYYDAQTPGAGVRSLFEVNIDLSHLLEDINDIRQRIDASYYKDLFLMLSSMAPDARMTATEVAERHEEKLLMLGPTLERLHNELLSPLIDITFDRIVAAGVLPPPPPELQNMELEVEFISVLAQAQRAVAASGADRLLTTVGNLSQFFPKVLNKINVYQAVDDYAEMFGVNPEIIISDEDAEATAEAQAQAAQAQAQAEAMPAMAQTAKAVSGIDPNAMSNVLTSLQGYGTPGGA